MMKIVIEDGFLNQILNIQSNYGNIKDLPFLADKIILDNTGKLITAIEDKEKYVIDI